ncbi:Os01g0747300, partial [Oryza sativa Japonica Group]
ISSGSERDYACVDVQEALAKTSQVESRIREDTEEAIRKMRAAGAVCSCARRAAAGDCRSCTLRHVDERLRDAGYNSAICKSKWTRSPDIPSGNFGYL